MMDNWDASYLKQRLKQARDYKSVPAKQIAESLEVGIDAYYKWERPEGNSPSHEKLARIANILRFDIRFFYMPKMSLEQADLDKRSREDALERLADRLEDIEEKIMPAAEYDPLAHHVKTHKELREVVEMLTKLDERSLIEARGLIRGFMVGSGKQDKEDPDAPPDEREKGNLNAG